MKFSFFGAQEESGFVLREFGHARTHQLGAVVCRMNGHIAQEVLASDPARITGVIASQRDRRRAALTGIDDQDGEMEPCEIDGGGQSGRASADNGAIDRR